MQRPYFDPWIGSNYESGGEFGLKILALGDSHYCESDCTSCGVIGDKMCALGPQLTKTTIIGYLDEYYNKAGWPTTFKKFERTLSGNYFTTIEDSRKIWDSIAFYNFIQTANHGGPRKAYPKDVYTKSLPYFKTILNELNPDIVVVWGTKVWDSLPYEGWFGEPMDEYNDIGFYNIQGKKIRFIWIYHPSYPHSYDNESKALNALIKKVKLEK